MEKEFKLEGEIKYSLDERTGIIWVLHRWDKKSMWKRIRRATMEEILWKKQYENISKNNM